MEWQKLIWIKSIIGVNSGKKFLSNEIFKSNNSFSENMIMRKNDKRLLNVKLAAEYLSISRSQLYKWVETGKIPSIRIDNRRLFDILELNDFVEKLKREQR